MDICSLKDRIVYIRHKLRHNPEIKYALFVLPGNSGARLKTININRPAYRELIETCPDAMVGVYKGDVVSVDDFVNDIMSVYKQNSL